LTTRNRYDKVKQQQQQQQQQQQPSSSSLAMFGQTPFLAQLFHVFSKQSK